MKNQKIIFSKLLCFIIIMALAVSAKALNVKDSTFSNGSNTIPVYVIDWTDNFSKPRKVVMTKPYAPDNYPGVCVLIKYYDGAVLKTITSQTPSDPEKHNRGFGCTVHHYSGSGWVDQNSPTLTMRFLGAHHAIIDLVQTIDGAVETVTYTFEDGLDYFQWQQTVNCSAVTSGTYDSRSPYSTVDWDGNGIFDVITGQEYEAQNYFNQPTYNGAFTFGTAGAKGIPFVRQWKNTSEIGYVQTQTYAQQQAGVPAYSATNIPASGGSVAGGYLWAFDYQMNFYDMAQKITWGMPYGYIEGQASTGTKSGWGQYSLSIIFDALASNGVKRVRDENVVIHNGNVALSASIGSVMTTGPVGTVNPATQTLSPVGYDHNYRAWWVQANGAGETVLAMNVSSGVLKNPLFRIKSMTEVPSVVEYNGIALVANVDYYASFNSATGEVWLTILKNVSGNNSIRIVDGVSSGIIINTATVTPSTVVNNISNPLSFLVNATDNGSVASVVLDLTSIGGGSSVSIVFAGSGNYNSTFTLPAGASTGSKTIVATVTDNLGNQKVQNIILNVNPAVTYLTIYTDPSSMVTGFWNSNGVLVEQNGLGAIEGVKDYRFNYTAVGWFAGFGLNLSNWSDAQAKDFSSYSSLEISYSGPFSAGTGIALTLAGVGSTQSVVYNLPAVASYSTVSIPLSSFAPFDLTKIIGLNFSVTGTASGTGSFYVDNIRLSNSLSLPVNFISFTTENNYSNETVLAWETTDEINSKGFEVEKSKDGIHFYKIGYLESLTNKGLNQYSFVDPEKNYVICYYRIKQIDNNGSYAYSTILLNRMILAPKVFYREESKSIVLSGQLIKEERVTIEVYSIQGQLLLNNELVIKEHTTEYEVKFNGVDNTFYVIHVQNEMGNFSEFKKILIKE